MSSKTESGMNTYAGNFQELIDVCQGFGILYNPTPEELRIESLVNQLLGVRTSVAAVDAAMPDAVAAESARQAVFALMPPLAIRVQAVAIILGLPDAIIVHIKEVVRKIHGRRAHALKPKTDSDQAPEKHISVSQVSFNEQIEHFHQLILLVSSQPAYAPAETDLKVPALNQLLNDMCVANDAAKATAIPLANARQERDRLLYAPKTGMMDTALRVKEYVKAVFGTKSPQYKEVQHIPFRNRSKN
jgi:hypothetical protein